MCVAAKFLMQNLKNKSSPSLGKYIDVGNDDFSVPTALSNVILWVELANISVVVYSTKKTESFF